MGPAETVSLLTPKQAAAALNVSESSVKRWCDAGSLVTERTSGGHRRIELAALMRYARDSGRKLNERTLLGASAKGGRVAPVETLVGRAEEALLAGDTAALERILVEWMARGDRLAGYLDNVMAAAMHRVGLRWHQGAIRVFEEHQATQALVTCLARAAALVAKPSDVAPLAICSALGGDPYVVAPTMTSLTLRECGFRTALLGADTPAESLREAIVELNPKLLILSISSVTGEQTFLKQYEYLQNSAATNGTKVAIGGRALTIELRKQMQYHFAGETLAHLASFCTSGRGAIPSVGVR